MELLTRLTDSPLFHNAEEETLIRAIRTGTVRSFQKGEVLTNCDNCLGLIVTGALQVYERTKERRLLLNTLRQSDFFGAATLFGGENDRTVFVAAEDSTVLMLSQKSVEQLMWQDFQFTRNYIVFLTEKICFLNGKISGFTAGSAEKKLAAYLSTLPREGDTAILPMSLVRLAGVLDVGRASLYRAFDDLEQRGLIEREKNRIRISGNLGNL